MTDYQFKSMLGWLMTIFANVRDYDALGIAAGLVGVMCFIQAIFFSDRGGK